MTKNDILRRVRYIFDLSDQKMIELFNNVDRNVSIEQLHAWFRDENHPKFKRIKDLELALLLNGLINDKRGKREGSPPKIEKQLTNNNIFMKLKIALDLQSEEVLDVLELSGLRISKHELSALFRKPGHKHYRECKDQIMRNFLMGLQLKLRPEQEVDNGFSWPV